MRDHRGVSLPKAVLLSLVASVIGAFLASCGFVAIEALVPRRPDAAMAPLALLIVFPVSLAFAIPAGLVVGAPTLWAIQRAIVRWPIAATIGLALLGSGLGYPIEHYLDAHSVQRGNDLALYMAWGAVVGGVHALTLAWTERRSIASTARAALAALIVVPLVAVSVVHCVQDAYARGPRSCDDVVFEVDPGLAQRADRAVGAPRATADRVTAVVGDWERYDEGSSSAHSMSAIFVNGRRAITINDRAVLPQSLLTDLGFSSRPEMRCSDRYAGPHREVVRRIARPIRLAQPEKAILLRRIF